MNLMAPSDRSFSDHAPLQIQNRSECHDQPENHQQGIQKQAGN